jgi:tetratricopeptide (TPR) repeat protein
MSASFRNYAVLILALVIAFGIEIRLSDYLEAHRISVPESYGDEDLDLQGKRLKGYALGTEGLLADWYWMRSLQYVGGKIDRSTDDVINLDNLRPLNPRLLYPLLDNATDLDPKFITAYSYGATVLPAIDPDQAIKLTQKGIANNPNSWRLYQYLGYIYWRLQQYDNAADVYTRGSQIDGAPPFLQMMAGMMKTRGGSRDTARSIYHQLYESAQDQQTKDSVMLRMQWLDSLDERGLLNSALSNFKEEHGRCAKSFAEIDTALAQQERSSGKQFLVNNSGQIVDPTGEPYGLDDGTCRATLGPHSKLPRD